MIQSSLLDPFRNYKVSGNVVYQPEEPSPRVPAWERTDLTCRGMLDAVKNSQYPSKIIMTLAVGMFIEGEQRIYGDCLYISGHLGPGR